MIKKMTILLFLVFQSAMAQEIYDKIRVWTNDSSSIISELLELGIDPEGLHVRQGVYVDAIVNQQEKQGLQSLGIIAEDLILDLSAHYASRLIQGASRELGYGSMGGYLTFDEIVASMDSLHALYPEIVSAKQSIGSSYEGRDIWAFKISDNPNMTDGDPEVLYNSLIHAREPAAMMTLMHFAWSLAENYQEDSRMTYLVDERDMWFIPVINPDGYIYNQLTNPDGGGMHRKNRRPGCNSSPGVDLNRNWGFMWGYDDEGSSIDPCYATYRGSQAFSEPETQVVRDFVLAHDFMTAFNYHSYGNLLIKPFGFDESFELPLPESEIYNQLGRDLVADNDYLFGTGTETVGYIVNGDAVDYMYGELGIINFTPEVGAGEDGAFWPPTEMIFELAEDNLTMNIHLAGCAGDWVELESLDLTLDAPLESGDIVTCALNVMNKGLGMGETPAMLYLSSPDSSITPSIASIDVAGLTSQALHDYGSDGLTFEINARHGELAQLTVAVEMSGHLTQMETYSWIVGVPDTIFYDDFQGGFDAWTSETWGLEMVAGGSQQFLSDSPSGLYSALSVSTVFLDDPLDLREVQNPVLRFDASWDIEVNYDFCQILGSIDDGATWVPLGGLHTDAGNGSTVQPLGEPGYHGTQDWIAEQISLAPFAEASEFFLKIQLRSDTFFQGDGFWVDNFAVLGWGPEFILGDVTQDGVTNITDVVFLLESIVANDALNNDALELADMNGDAQLDVRDLVMLIELILNQ